MHQRNSVLEYSGHFQVLLRNDFADVQLQTFP